MTHEDTQEAQMRMKLNGRVVAALLAGMLVGAMFTGPAVGHIGRSVAHLWVDHIKPRVTTLTYTKEQANTRFTGNTLVRVSEEVTINSGSFNGANVFCPQGYEVIAGGVEGGNLLTMVVTASAPIFGRDDPATPAAEHKFLPEQDAGDYANAEGWSGFMRNNDSVARNARVAAICAKR